MLPAEIRPVIIAAVNVLDPSIPETQLFHCFYNQFIFFAVEYPLKIRMI